jgi:hypothetical protein
MANPRLARAVLLAAISGLGMTIGCGDDSAPPLTPTLPGQLTLGSVAPNSGPEGVATPVRIIGTGFQAGVKLTLDGVETPVVVESSTLLRATVPAHAAGPIDVVVTNPDGKSSRLTGGYTYVTRLTGLTLSGNLSLTSIGETSQLTAVAEYSDGATRDVTRETQWSVTFPTIAVISTDGVLTARALGATSILARYPVTNPSMFRSAQVTVTPAGSFALYGRVREPGAGGINGARVGHLTSGESSMTDVNGYYSLASLTGAPRLTVTKSDYEDVELEVPLDQFNDIPMQRITRLAVGDMSYAGRLAPNDMDYLVAGGTHCQPCRLIRLTSATTGRAQLKLTWTANVSLRIWADGREHGPEPGIRELVVDVPVGAADVIVFVGRIRPAEPEDGTYLPFTLSAHLIDS